mgnify:CR=1 FL=1
MKLAKFDGMDKITWPLNLVSWKLKEITGFEGEQTTIMW